jgi:hypothetical protein|tara:strand:+ start:20 stop:343 length:324 start_codon:yes stop_codon:yes gene_type:complete
MKHLLVFPILLLTLWVVYPAASAEGIVVLNDSGCRSRYVVETSSGYAILEWFGGNDPSEGSRIVGDFESYGMPNIYNKTANSEGKVWVEDYWLSRSRVMDKMQEFCN